MLEFMKIYPDSDVSKEYKEFGNNIVTSGSEFVQSIFQGEIGYAMKCCTEEQKSQLKSVIYKMNNRHV